ncbi:hypothetical protein BV22DRAFT_1027066 [Leucogyrophana mollusca]|uniref:Uncharacterized protein n=1 Tax=Leucogyrophana mollusca TaxID=85980 RepID=A0ACB8AVP0_9AGAM|nr:hypothetical protein BV22DRAFT_1027066 [Leucogyrophana mollusca]
MLSFRQEFVTHLLFSSPRLRFSEAQKKAVLSWADAIGATGVPSLYSLKKTQDRIRDLIGDPTEKVDAISGNTFYINSVGKAIAKDYANPLTRLTMQDYPEDGQGQMSQVHHGDKMLHHLPDDLAAPSVRVDNNIFFVDELLQQSSRGYYIPKKFFQAKTGTSGEAQVLALGHNVSRTNVSVSHLWYSHIKINHIQAGFAVDPECVLTPVSRTKSVW